MATKSTHGETRGRALKSCSKSDRRSKALVIKESSEKPIEEPSSSSSSDESESSRDEKELICLFAQEESNEEMCLMLNDEEVNSTSTSYSSNSHDNDCVDHMDSVFKLIKDFKCVKNYQSKVPNLRKKILDFWLSANLSNAALTKTLK